MEALVTPATDENELEESYREPISVESFFSIGLTAKCLVLDCKSELKTKTKSHLTRHIEQMHPSKLRLIELTSINSMSLPILRQSTLNLLVRHVTIHGRPLSSINDSSFRELLSERMTRLRARGPHKLTLNVDLLRKTVFEMAERVKEKIKQEARGRMMSLMMDIASKHHRSIFGVSIQFIVNSEIKIRTIMMEKILTRHTAENLAKMLKKIFDAYDIPLCNVFAINSDNGRNMLATTNELDELALTNSDEWFDSGIASSLISMIEQEDRSEMLAQIAQDVYNNENIVPFNYQYITAVRCGSHTYQRAVEAAWNSSKCIDTGVKLIDVISSARSVVKELRTGTWLLYLEESGVPIPAIDNITRWFSIHIMLFSLLKCKQFILDKAEEIRVLEEKGEKIDKTKKMKNVLTEFEWKVIEEAVDVMHPAYELMKKMQTNSFTLSEFYSTWTLIKISMRRHATKSNLLTDLSTEMQKNMLNYEPRLFMNPLLLCCLYLDPRVSGVLEQTDDQGTQRKAVAKSEVTKVYQRLKQQNIEPEIPIPNNNRFSRFVDLETDFDLYIESLHRNPSSIEQNSNREVSLAADLLTLELECIEYEKEKRLPLRSNVLQFWELNKKKYPTLFSVSQVIMAVPSSQTSIERCFSSFGFIYSNSRTLLSAEIMQAILLIRANADVFEDVASDKLVEAAAL